EAPRIRAGGDDPERAIAELPVEVVVRHAQDDLFPSIRILERIRHVLPADMHVRPHEHQLSIHIECDIDRRTLPVRVIRRDAARLASLLPYNQTSGLSANLPYRHHKHRCGVPSISMPAFKRPPSSRLRWRDVVD